jgi:DNA helicase-2/ATP-dependent DNA helicase PcrA
MSEPLTPHVASSPLLQGLNPEQMAAVTLPPEHALILAGAGSGKTRVLTTRIAWLLQTGQITPGGMLAVTFTNKAAKEMMTRLGAMLPVNVRGMWIGTFHGLCNRLLRAHHKLVNLPQTVASSVHCGWRCCCTYPWRPCFGMPPRWCFGTT